MMGGHEGLRFYKVSAAGKCALGTVACNPVYLCTMIPTTCMRGHTLKCAEGWKAVMALMEHEPSVLRIPRSNSQGIGAGLNTMD